MLAKAALRFPFSSSNTQFNLREHSLGFKTHNAIFAIRPFYHPFRLQKIPKECLTMDSMVWRASKTEEWRLRAAWNSESLNVGVQKSFRIESLNEPFSVRASVERNSIYLQCSLCADTSTDTSIILLYHSLIPFLPVRLSCESSSIINRVWIILATFFPLQRLHL